VSRDCEAEVEGLSQQKAIDGLGWFSHKLAERFCSIMEAKFIRSLANLRQWKYERAPATLFVAL